MDSTEAPATLRLTDVSLRFGPVQALSKVSFDVRPGEVHALVGQNGSGKSTLMKVAYGEYSPDEGSLAIGGEVCTLSSPNDAIRRGVAFVAQELPFVDSLSVKENLFLGQLPRRHGLVSFRRMTEAAQSALARLGTAIPLEAPMADLEMDQRQMVAIARAISGSPRALILDEPTSALNEDQVDRLYDVIKRLSHDGMGVIIISQRLRDVRNVGDRITVLRDGQVVGTMAADTFDEDHVAFLMVGENGAEPSAPTLDKHVGEPLLEIDQLHLDGRCAVDSMTVRSGEIVGLAGFEGSGKGDVVRSIYGLRNRGKRSVVRVAGRTLPRHNPSSAARAGLGFVTGIRSDSLFFEESVESNLSIVEQAKCSVKMQNRRRQRQMGVELIGRLGIRPPLPQQAVRYLSGGNQQKVALGKWLARGCKVLILEDPTRGVDVVARRQLHDEIRSLARSGSAVLISSSDTEELIELCSRVVVMSRGRAVQSFDSDGLSEARVLAAAGGHA